MYPKSIEEAKQCIRSAYTQNPQIPLWVMRVMFLIVMILFLILRNYLVLLGTSHVIWVLWLLWGLLLALNLRSQLEPKHVEYFFWCPILR